MRASGARAESNRLVKLVGVGALARETMELVGLRQSVTEIAAFFAGGAPAPHELELPPGSSQVIRQRQDQQNCEKEET